MFSTNPFPHLTSTIHVFPPTNYFHDYYENDDLHNRTNNSDPIPTGDSFPATENFTTCNHLFRSEVKKKKSWKKDHHSKIHTPQGPRDRRVRLSIEVAKKFFYLQDLLGVDKASKTLDWLFTKSKISIDELIERKKQTSSSTVTEESETVFLNEQDEGGKKKCGKGKRKKITRKYKYAVKHSRAEARARARERTKEKLTLKSSLWNSVELQNECNDNLGGVNDSSAKLICLPKFTADVHQQSGHYATI